MTRILLSSAGLPSRRHLSGVGRLPTGAKCRARVTLATRLSAETCSRLNLGYRGPEGIRPQDYANREDEGILLAPKAGEMLFRLKNPPPWAGGAGNPKAEKSDIRRSRDHGWHGFHG